MRHGSDCKQLGCFSPVNPQESAEEPGLILNNSVVIHLQGFSYLMRLEAECFALSLRDLRN